MNFNVKTDIDLNRLKALAFEEAAGIFSHPSRARGRTIEEIREVCLLGKAPEVYLMDNCGFTDDPSYCKDVLDPFGIPVEIKTTTKESYVPYVLKRANEQAHKSYRKYQKLLYIFIANVYNGEYTLHGIYKWNGKEFA